MQENWEQLASNGTADKEREMAFSLLGFMYADACIAGSPGNQQSSLHGAWFDTIEAAILITLSTGKNASWTQKNLLLDKMHRIRLHSHWGTKSSLLQKQLRELVKQANIIFFEKIECWCFKPLFQMTFFLLKHEVWAGRLSYCNSSNNKHRHF